MSAPAGPQVPVAFPVNPLEHTLLVAACHGGNPAGREGIRNRPKISYSER